MFHHPPSQFATARRRKKYHYAGTISTRRFPAVCPSEERKVVLKQMHMVADVINVASRPAKVMLPNTPMDFEYVF